MSSPKEELIPLSGHLQELRYWLLCSLAVFLIIFSGLVFSYHPLLEALKKPLSHIFQTEVTSFEKQSVKTYTITNTSDTPLAYDCQECQETGIWWDKKTLEKDGRFIIPPGGQILVTKKAPAINLVFLSPTEGFFVVLKITFWAALLLSMPFWGYFLYQFIKPALSQRIKHPLISLFFTAIICVIAGVCSALYLVIPAANQYLTWFNTSLGENIWSFAQYIDYSLMLIFACCLACYLGASLFLAVHFGLISVSLLAEYRRHAIVAAFVIAAILTPPDVFTQVIVAVPLCILYELSILYGKLKYEL